MESDINSTDPMLSMAELQRKFCELTYIPKLMVVEDDADYIKLLSMLFIPLNYTVKFVTTAFQALAKLRDEKLDLVWIDLRLPDMTGVELIKMIVKNCRPAPPIIVVSGLDPNSEPARDAKKLGVYLVEPKPNTVDELRAMLKKVNPKT